MLVIGLYAGVGAGKSTVARLFGELGAVVLDADEMVSQAYKEPEVKQRILKRFGSEAWDMSRDEPNRRWLANHVFAATDPAAAQARRDLEDILHPRVRQLFEAAIAQAKRQEVAAIVLDVPLLATSPLQQWVTTGVFVDAPLEVRQARCQATRGWPPDEVARRDALQPSLDQKRRLCRHTIVNDALTTVDDLRRQVREIWRAEGREHKS